MDEMRNERTDVQVVGYVTGSEREAIASAARADGRKVAAWIRQAIREKLEREAQG